jgi:hypothetical protein
LDCAVEAHGQAARGLAAAVSRPWLPLALAAAAVAPRARLPVAAAVLARSMAVRRRTEPELGASSWLALRALDDLAFSAGVVRGCVAAGQAAPLLPTARRAGDIEPSVLGREVLLP